MAHSPIRLFVTGGRGSLAALIADHFLAPRFEVTLFSRNSLGSFRPVTDLHRPGIVAEADMILHLAWSSLPATSEQHPGIEQAEDLPYLNKLLDSISRVPTQSRPGLVFFSTGGAVYGNARQHASCETDSCAPMGSYGRAKLLAEDVIRECAASRELEHTVLRISNPYGYPVPSSRAQGLIPHALRCASQGQPLAVWGDGSAQKDFIYYSDFLAALEAVVTNRLTGTFNLSYGQSHSIREVLGLVETHIGKSLALNFGPPVQWDVHDSRLDNTKLMHAADWSPMVPLSEGIRRAAAAYVQQY